MVRSTRQAEHGADARGPPDSTRSRSHRRRRRRTRRPSPAHGCRRFRKSARAAGDAATSEGRSGSGRTDQGRRLDYRATSVARGRSACTQSVNGCRRAGDAPTADQPTSTAAATTVVQRPFLVADGGLGHVLRADDLVREAVDLFLLVPALVGIELEAERRREHLGGELLGVVPGDVFALAEAVVLGQVPVECSGRAGIATPTVAAISRCGSRVAASDMTTKVTCPGSSRFMPCGTREDRHLGGKMLDTRTRLHAAMPADRSASSNEVSFSRCFPTPFVKNISLGTNPTTSRSLHVSRDGAW